MCNIIRLIKSCSSIGIMQHLEHYTFFQIGIVINASLAAHIGHTCNKDEGKNHASFCLLGVLLDTYFNNLLLASSTRAIICDVYIIYLHYIPPAEQN